MDKNVVYLYHKQKGKKQMDTKLFIIFIVANILNVILQTVKSLATVKCGKGSAALINAVSYGFYTYVIVLTVCDLPLWLKVCSRPFLLCDTGTKRSCARLFGRI